MFNSSLRRVVRNCPNPSVPTRTVTNHGSITATFTTHTHQRRHSSSKPPIPPNNGAPSIPAASVKNVGAPRSEKRPGAESRLSKRKVTKGEKAEGIQQREDVSNEWTRTLPSVPSTQHLNPKDVYVASFFSTHRPISITGPLPPEMQAEDIEKMFQSRPKSQRRKTQDVIYTLSSTVQNLDEQISNQQQGSQQDEGVSQRADLIKALTQHNTGVASSNESNHPQQIEGQPQTSIRVPGNVRLVIQEFARRFRPFNVPPAPEPVPEIDLMGREEEANETEASSPTPDSLERIRLQRHENDIDAANQSANAQAEHMILEVSQESSSSVKAASNFFTSQIPQSNRSGRTRRGLHSANDLRRIKMTGLSLRNRRPGSMYTISVKRQRKLKMKKHKLKKLRRSTRNLRRRQGKI